jgi:hypothetical protein
MIYEYLNQSGFLTYKRAKFSIYNEFANIPVQTAIMPGYVLTIGDSTRAEYKSKHLTFS